MKKKSMIFIFIVLIIIGLSGCSPEEVNKKQDKIQIVTSLFPQFDFAKEIAGDLVEVKLLLPPGVEPHAYDPTPRDMVAIKEADIFIYTNEYMEPWVEGIVKNLSEETTSLDASDGIELALGHDHDHEDEHEHEEEEEDHHDHNEGKDPHIWLNPLNAIKMAENIKDSLVKVDPEHSIYFEENFIVYKNKLLKLDQDIMDQIGNKNLKVVFGGHFAFGYFAERYGLEYISPYKGFTPDGEPSSRSIVKLIKEIREDKIDIIYHEELIDPKIAEILAKETNSKLLPLNSIHNISRDELSRNVNYIDMMYRNLSYLREGIK